MAQSSERQIPTYEEVLGYLSKDRAWVAGGMTIRLAQST